ncbi:MAG: TerB family tellurite resistance protein [Deltaproteobacteria bacterium]|nr:TerB family tellurite resistance protein [Deltaproteobacteria bacterium]
MLDQLDRVQRLRLMRFVCSFAWADLQIQPEERRFVSDLVGRLELEEEERQRVKGWLEVPPSPEEIDPTAVPHAHRRIFVDAIKGVIAADGEINFEERSALELFEMLLRGE